MCISFLSSLSGCCVCLSVVCMLSQDDVTHCVTVVAQQGLPGSVRFLPPVLSVCLVAVSLIASTRTLLHFCRSLFFHSFLTLCLLRACLPILASVQYQGSPFPHALLAGQGGASQQLVGNKEKVSCLLDCSSLLSALSF